MAATKRVVVTGMGIICALGHDYDQVLRKMKDSQSGIANVERFSTEGLQCRIGAEVKDYCAADYFDEAEQKQFDRCAQYGIVAAKRALQDSQLRLDESLKQQTGLMLGTCNGGILSLEEQWTIKSLDQAKTSRYPFYQQGDDIAGFFDLHGPVTTINTACSASGSAIGFASDMIKNGYAEVMLAGGSDPLSHTVYAGFNVLRALSPQPTAPYSEPYGLSLGEGASFLVLESLSRALQRGARIYGEMCGYGLSNDAYHETASQPEGSGMARAVKMAFSQSALTAEKIGYINAHGTGTKSNDRAEINGLRSIFQGEQLNRLSVSSSKGYFGHTLGAAAAIELSSSLFALRHGLLPATLHFAGAREGCELSGIVANRMQEGAPKYILSNNSAFGGHNASIAANIDTRYEAPMREGSTSLKCKVGTPSRRIGIVGIGSVMFNEAVKGGIFREGLTARSDEEKPVRFSLKSHDPTLYERRMNPLTQFSLAAAQLAMQDANWAVQPAGEQDIGESDAGFIYGTSRGSLDSIGRYLSSVFEQGAEYASSIDFPYNVLNSTAGKMAQKLKLTGYSSSISTGGNEGLMSVLLGSEVIRGGIHGKCLVGAGDEHSPLSEQISRAKGLDNSRYNSEQGSCCIALAQMGDPALEKQSNVYAEIKGFGLAFDGAHRERGVGLQQAMAQALQKVGMKRSQIDLVVLNTIGRPGELECEQYKIEAFYKQEKEISVVCFNPLLGYGESISSLQQLAIAAELLHSPQSAKGWMELEFDASSLQHIMVVSSSVNGNSIAVILSKM